ncbi:MAG: hypothetical protein Q9166_006792, partial [cf. Caloplaca sp. 2 TL-2023]
MESMSPKDVTSFFFCRFDDQESLKASTIIGCIARQLVNDAPEDAFRGFSHETAIMEFLKITLSDTRQYFIILDGLDECNEVQIQEVSESLDSLLSSPHLHIKIFWCSRPNVVDWLPLKLQSQQHISLESVESQGRIASDIGRFINVTLEDWLEGDSPKLRISDPTLILTIVRCLENGAHGIHLPRDLPQTFERILAKFTEAEDVDIGSKIFRWVAVAKRPLTIQELREAIGVEPLQDIWDPRCLINDMKKAMACCGNLLFIEEEQQTIHFTHSSVLQYLRSNFINKSLSRYYIDLEQADADAGAICVTYLNLPVFNTQMVRKSKVNFNTTAITSTVVKNSLPAGKSANKVALSFLRRQDRSSKSVQRLLEETAGGDELSRRNAMLGQYLFFPYAQKFWLEHTKQRIMPKSGRLWILWCNLLEDAQWRDTLSCSSWTLEDWEKRSTNVIQWTVENDHCSLAQLLVDSERELTPENLGLLIEGAARRGNAELMEVSLGSENIAQTLLNSSLQSAAGGGHLAVVERLLQEKADVNATSIDGGTALQAAAGGGHLAVVERLLQKKADVNAINIDGGTALQAAAGGGHLAVVERLLQKAGVNAAATYKGSTALQAAAGGGHLAVVEKLLKEKADINAAATSKGSTALQAAAGGGYLAVVERLLQENAHVNAPAAKIQGRTALQAATGGGYLAVVERLLQENAY